jgi:hypothetical protein
MCEHAPRDMTCSADKAKQVPGDKVAFPYVSADSIAESSPIFRFFSN